VNIICMSSACFQYSTFNRKSMFRVRVNVTVRVRFRVT